MKSSVKYLITSNQHSTQTKRCRLVKLCVVHEALNIFSFVQPLADIENYVDVDWTLAGSLWMVF